MREVLAAAGAGEPAARLALEVYLHRLRAGVAAMAAALGGLDALAFTGGVGENAPAVRAGAADGLGFLGIGLDPERNARRTATPSSRGGAPACARSCCGPARTWRSRARPGARCGTG